MNLKIEKLICMVLLTSILSTVVMGASRLRQDDPLRKEVSEDVNSIKALIKGDHIEGLEMKVDELEKKWFPKNKKYYRLVIDQIAQTLNGTKNYDIADKYTKKALDKLYALPDNEKVSFEDIFYLTGQINQNFFSKFNKNFVKEKDWPENRREAAKYYFLVLERLEKSIDSEEEIKKKTSNASYPELSKFHIGGVRGMSPDSIKDPEIRARYEKELNEYWEAAGYMAEQRNLRRIKETDIAPMQRIIIHLYSGPEFISKELETDALKQDIEKYVKDKKIVSTIMEGLKNRLTEDLKSKLQGQSMTGSFSGHSGNRNSRGQKEQLPPGYDKEHSFTYIYDDQNKE